MSRQTECGGGEPSLSVAEAGARLIDACKPVQGWEKVAVRSALGRVLARDIVAPVNVPGHDNSAMDGYAVRAGDLGPEETPLRVVGAALAGRAFPGELGPSEAIRVMTGAVMPSGADSVVIQEVARVDGERVLVPPCDKPGQNVRRAGEDLAAGRAAVAAGRRVGASELGLIASLGFAEVTVYRRPRVAFFSTGDELASIGRPLAPGEVYDSNRYTLFAALRALGMEILDMGVVRDDPQPLERAFTEASAQADVVISTGGVSVGEADYIRDILGRLGDIHFWRIAIKPGRPMAFGRLGNAWFFGLPGNPVAVLVCFYQIVRDALLRLQGLDPIPPHPVFRVPCTSAIRKRPGRLEFPRGVLHQEAGQWCVRLTGSQGSGVLRSMTDGNCFIRLPEDCAGVSPGDVVEVQPFDGVL